MANYSWPLGDKFNAEYMDTDNFLKNCRKETRNGYYNTVEWRCQPGYLPFNYITNYYPISGVGQEITAGGVFTESGIIINPAFQNFIFPDEYVSVFNSSRRMTSTNEGVRLTKLYYRINDGKWMELSSNLKKVSFDLSSNNDKVEIKATYQVWTMGNPHSPIPFMWLGNEYGIYNNNNSFTDAVPVNPGRKYSGMMNYCNGKDYNADWKLHSVGWFAPGSTMLESNWAYQNAMNFRDETASKLNVYLNTWSNSDNCQRFDDNYMNKPPGFFNYIYQYGWKYNYPEYNTKDTITEWWESPYKTRKGMWWVYEKTFTDTYVASGIKQQQVNAPVKDVTLKVVQDDRTTKFDKGSKWLNGTNGKLLIEFSGPSLAFVDVYAVQKISLKEEMTIKLISGEAITGGITNTIDIKFNKYPQLYRSKDIAYYIEIFTVSGGYPKYEYRTDDKTYTALIANGTHYYNDEPPWISNVEIQKVKTYGNLPDPLPVEYRNLDKEVIEKLINKKELYYLTWDAPKDPDGDNVQYSFLIDEGNYENINFSTAEDYNLTYGRESSWVLRSRRSLEEGETENVTLINAEKATIKMTDSTSALYTLPVSRLKRDSNGNFIDPLNIWIVPHDGRTNDYYYGTRINLLHTGYDPISLDIIEGSSNDKISIRLTHNDFINATVDVKVYAFMSNKQDDNSSGKYLGIIYDGPLDPGYTTKTFSLYDKINGEQKFKRGHYIKFAVSCEDLNQDFNPYAEDAWNSAVGYHKFNILPTASTPFLCEKNDTVFDDSIARISWNKSVDNDTDSTVNYYIYISSINKPELNTKSASFWINNEDDTNRESRKYYKVVNAGTSSPTVDLPYKLDLSEFKKGDVVKIWITTKDKNNSTKYLTGGSLMIGASDTKINAPQVKLYDVKAYNLLGKEDNDGESGSVRVCQTNPSGEGATVILHAMCRKISGPNAGDTKIFENVATWNLKSGEWSPYTKIIYKTAFGEEWSNSYVKYYAVTITNSGLSSFDLSYMNTNMYNKWSDQTHVYNEQPAPYIIRDTDKTNLHSNIHISWNYLIDENFRDLDDVILVEGTYDSSTPKIFR